MSIMIFGRFDLRVTLPSHKVFRYFHSFSTIEAKNVLRVLDVLLSYPNFKLRSRYLRFLEIFYYKARNLIKLCLRVLDYNADICIKTT
jgi:hypothetical protein